MATRDLSEEQIRADTNGRYHLLFLAHLASTAHRDPPLAPSTVTQAGVAVRDHYRIESWKTSRDFADFNKGLRHAVHSPPQKKLPFRSAWLRRLIRQAGATGRVSNDACALITLLSVGFHGALRRSELAALNVGDVTFDSAISDGRRYKYAVICIRKSKTDQAGVGQQVYLPKTQRTVCAYRWLKKLRHRLRPSLPPSYPLFSFNGARIKASDIAWLVKQTVERFSREDSSRYSGHSLRRGGLTALYRAGAPLIVVQQHARHRSPESTAAYITTPLSLLAGAMRHV